MGGPIKHVAATNGSVFYRGKVASSAAVRGGFVLWKESFVNKLLVCSHGAIQT